MTLDWLKQIGIRWIMDIAQLRHQEREILKNRRNLQLNERRAKRRSDLKLTQSSTANGKAMMIATTLSDVENITTRPGFLRQQLKMQRLTPSRRWYFQLKLMVAEDSRTEVDGDDMETAMQSCEAVLCRDQRCYDVVYREGMRVTDARESLLDETAPVDVRELLSFSTRSESFVCRVTCVHDGKQVLFSSTTYIENLQMELQHQLAKGSSVNAVIDFIWNALKEKTSKR